MDRLHTEVLILQGRDLHGYGGSKLSSVIVSRDDDLETFDPKNHIAITRTKNFMDSKLSAIFGGKLRSVTKPRGKYMSFTPHILV